MIITKIRLQEEHPMSSGASSWPLPYCDLNLDITAGLNGYILSAVQGLDPPDFNAVVDGFDAFGVPIMDNIPSKRDIVFRIALTPVLGKSYSDLRDDLYKLISRNVLISFMNDTLVRAQCTGFIRHFEALHFSSKPEIQITIECHDGVFRAPNKVDIPLTLLDTLTPFISYEDGTAPAGLDLKFTYTAVATGTGFSISNHSEFWYVGTSDVFNVFEVEYPLETDDVVTISTHPKERRVTLLRDAIEYDLAGYINAGAIWPKLYTGVNTFEWTFASSWMDWISASYIPRFWGV